MLTDAELSVIRADVARMLPDTGYVLSLSSVSDGQGGYTDSWGTSGTVTYRLDARQGHESVAGAAVQPYHEYTLTLPYTTTLTTLHRFKDASGNTYAVMSVDNGKSWPVSKRAIVERV